RNKALLRGHRVQNQNGLKEDYQKDKQRKAAKTCEPHAPGDGHHCLGLVIQKIPANQVGSGEAPGEVRGPGRLKRKLPLFEKKRPVLEEKLKNRIHRTMEALCSVGAPLRHVNFFSVTHGIDDGIDPHLVGIRGILRRISGKIGPFPGVSQVGIPVNNYHKPAVLIKDTATMGDIPVLFVSYAIVQGVADIRYLQYLGNVVVAMKDFMEHGNLDDGAAGEDAIDSSLEKLTFRTAPK